MGIEDEGLSFVADIEGEGVGGAGGAAAAAGGSEFAGGGFAGLLREPDVVHMLKKRRVDRYE